MPIKGKRNCTWNRKKRKDIRITRKLRRSLQSTRATLGKRPGRIFANLTELVATVKKNEFKSPLGQHARNIPNLADINKGVVIFGHEEKGVGMEWNDTTTIDCKHS